MEGDRSNRAAIVASRCIGALHHCRATDGTTGGTGLWYERRSWLSAGRRTTSLGLAVNSRIVGGRRWEQSSGDRCSQVHRRPPSLSGYGWDHRRSRAVVRVAVVALRGEENHKSRCGCELADRRWASMGAIERRSARVGASAPSPPLSIESVRKATTTELGEGKRRRLVEHRRATPGYYFRRTVEQIATVPYLSRQLGLHDGREPHRPTSCHVSTTKKTPPRSNALLPGDAPVNPSRRLSVRLRRIGVGP